MCFDLYDRRIFVFHITIAENGAQASKFEAEFAASSEMKDPKIYTLSLILIK